MSDIKKSSNYEQFGTLNGNRELKELRVQKLMKSIQEKNMLEENPVIISTGKVIDGQTRIEAAKRLKIPFYYIEREGANIDDVRRLNIYSSPWTINDFMDSYIKLGNEDYMILRDFTKKYNLPISVGVALLSSGDAKSGPHLNYFKAGKFKVTHLKDADEKASALMKIQPYTEGHIWRTRDFISALIRVWSKVDKDKFQEKVTSRGVLIRTRITVKDYLRDLEDIYNHGLKENQIRFYK